MDWESKGLEACFQIPPWPALSPGHFPSPNYNKAGLAPTTLCLCSLQRSPRFTEVPGLSCKFRSSVICMGSVKVHVTTSPTQWQCAGGWGWLDKYILSWVTATEVSLAAQPLLTQRCVFSRYKTKSQHLLSLLSAAVNTVVKVCKPWALSWEWEAASLAHCAERLMVFQRMVIRCDGKSLT